jgi:hypothetical protein
MLAKTARQKVLVNEKNGPRYITKDEAICMQLVNKTAGGDLKAIDLYIKFRMISSPGMVKLRDKPGLALERIASTHRVVARSCTNSQIPTGNNSSGKGKSSKYVFSGSERLLRSHHRTAFQR